MSILRVTVTEADEKYAPPSQEIEITVVADRVFITVYKGSLDDLKEGRTKEYEVPVLLLEDLFNAISAQGTVLQRLSAFPTFPQTETEPAEVE